MSKPPTKILDWGKTYDAGELFGDARLIGFELAVVSSGIHGAKVALVSTPPWCTGVQSEEADHKAA